MSWLLILVLKILNEANVWSAVKTLAGKQMSSAHVPGFQFRLRSQFLLICIIGGKDAGSESWIPVRLHS